MLFCGTGSGGCPGEERPRCSPRPCGINGVTRQARVSGGPWRSCCLRHKLQNLLAVAVTGDAPPPHHMVSTTAQDLLLPASSNVCQMQQDASCKRQCCSSWLSSSSSPPPPNAAMPKCCGVLRRGADPAPRASNVRNAAPAHSLWAFSVFCQALFWMQLH